MLGIPTYSDVQDPEFQRARVLHDLEERLGSWYWPTSTVAIHNHRLAMGLLGFGRALIPRNDLGAKEMLDHYTERINEYRENLAKARAEGLVQETAQVQSTARTGEPQGLLERLFTRSPTKLDRSVVREEPYDHKDHKPGYAKFLWQYTFNPLALAQSELVNYERALQEGFDSSDSDAVRLSRMHAVVEAFDKSENKHFIDMCISARKAPHPWILERKEGTEANRLRQENETIAGKSDMYLRFDEHCIVTKLSGSSSSQIPAQVLLDPEEPGKFTSGGLWHRQSLRDYAARFVEEKGSFVFNGVRYTPRTWEAGGESLDILVTDGPSFPVVANLFGKAISQPDGLVKPPYEAYAEEVDLVANYRMNPRGYAERFLAGYDGFRRKGVSEHDALEHLAHTLKDDSRWVPSGMAAGLEVVGDIDVL